MTMSRRALAVEIVILVVVAAFMLWVAGWPGPSPLPCGPSTPAPATGSHDRGRTI